MTRNTTEFDEFDWSLGPSAGDEELDRVRDHMERIQQRRAELDPDDRTWFTIPENSSSGLFVKLFRHDSCLQRSRYTLFGSQADTEWKHLLHLHDRNVPVPPPVVLGQRTSSGLLHTCILVTRNLGGTTLREVLEKQYGTPGWVDLRSPLWETLADVTAQLIKAGFYHRDYHDQNIVVTPDDRPGDAEELSLHVTDLHRASLSASMDTNEISTMLAFLLYALRTVVPLWECRRFYRTLEQKQPANGSLPDWQTVLNALQARRRTHRVRRTSDCFEDNDQFAISAPGNGWTVHHDASVSLEDVQGWMQDAREGTNTPSIRILKERSDGRVLHLTADDVVIEETTGKLFRRKLQRLIGQSKARTSWKNAHGMTVRDIPAPDGIALVEPTNSFSDRPSYFIRTFEDGQRVDHLLQELDSGTVAGPPDKTTLLRALVDFVGTLHTEGVFQKDMKANNVLVTATESTVDFRLIDLDRVTFYDRPLPKNPRLKNLVQLNASLSPWLTRTERRDAWTRYLNRPDVPFTDAKEHRKQIVEWSRRRME